MTEDKRDQVIALNRKRRTLRAGLASDLQQARHDLHPSNLAKNWVGRKKQQLSALAESGKQKLANNAPLIGLAGTAILFFAARKPISRLYHQLRDKARNAEDQDK